MKREKDENRTGFMGVVLILLIIASMVSLVFLVYKVYISPDSKIEKVSLPKITKTETKENIVGNYSEKGDGVFYSLIPTGTSEDGNIPMFYMGEDAVILSYH